MRIRNVFFIIVATLVIGCLASWRGSGSPTPVALPSPATLILSRIVLVTESEGWRGLKRHCDYVLSEEPPVHARCAVKTDLVDPNIAHVSVTFYLTYNDAFHKKNIAGEVELLEHIEAPTS